MLGYNIARPFPQVLRNRGKGIDGYVRESRNPLSSVQSIFERVCVHTQEIGSAVIDITSTICDIEYTIVLSACTGAAPFSYIKPSQHLRNVQDVLATLGRHHRPMQHCCQM